MTTKTPKTLKAPQFARLDRDPSSITLADAAAWVAEQYKDGAICPCCTQFAKRYKRKLSSNMVYVLILMRRAFKKQTDWLHVPEYLAGLGETGPINRGGDYAKMVYWGLIVNKTDEARKDGSNRTGFYKMTDRGNEFVQGEILVPRHAFVYAGKCIGFSEETTSIQEALHSRFNYTELMNG